MFDRNAACADRATAHTRVGQIPACREPARSHDMGLALGSFRPDVQVAPPVFRDNPCTCLRPAGARHRDGRSGSGPDMERSKLPDKADKDSRWAGGLTALAHLALGLLLWADGGAGGGRATGGQGTGDGSGSGLTVVLIDLPPREQRDAKPTTSPERIADSASDPRGAADAAAEPVTPPAETGLEPTAVHGVPEGDGIGARADTSDARASAGGGGSGYLAAVRRTIRGTWEQLHPDRPFPECSLSIQQVTGGAVSSAKGRCASEDTQRLIEAVTLMAQPLPYAGYESDFRATLDLEL